VTVVIVWREQAIVPKYCSRATVLGRLQPPGLGGTSGGTDRTGGVYRPPVILLIDNYDRFIGSL